MRMDRGGGIASPPYPFRHSGVALVCGNAWCLHDDLERARQLYPDAVVIAVNGAAREVKAFALFSQHPDRFSTCRWIHWQRRIHGDFTVHGCKKRDDCPWVDHWWEDARGGGSSAWGARKVAGLMGFDTIVLCGCPMITGPYAQGHAMGGYMMHGGVVDDLFMQIVEDKGWHEGVYSLSGRTRDLFGEPSD